MSNETSNPYQAYFNAMMDMQKEMANAYFEAQRNGNWDPNMPPPMGMPPFMMQGQQMHPPFMHQTGMHPGMMPPHWQQHGMPPNQPQQQVPPTNGASSEQENNVFMDQAQAMLDGALGEDANTFKEILGSFGMSDKEFWKGAMVGAAAALILSNDNVRGKLMGLVSGAGDMLKTGGDTVKETAVSTASTVKENVSTSSEIFKDTYAAGKQGYQDSVQRHKAEPVIQPLQPGQEPTDSKSDDDTPAIQEQ
ncbi:YtxH domain-containing protein [Vibrio sp. SNU_ST1]|uniref:YtxH domain-containing protein n=1 Tax=Vibrio sp. SNU_ST1 TaxID=3064001 RepID=UPI00272CF18B|nr:YtxH domain-containing protein [Vibrio sp. SNU_ST1]WKY60504.1 YtxH domain-containing protein [Vibrio sp. SNU_ST1]